MKKKCIKLILFFSIIYLFAACSSVPKEDDVWVYNSDKTLGILAKKDGFQIKKNYSSKYNYIEIHFENLSNPKNNLFIIKASKNQSDYFYPFLKKGQKYKVYLSLKEKNNSKEIISKSVEVISEGGVGEMFINTSVSSKSYNCKKWEVIFDKCHIQVPKNAKILPVEGYICTKNESVFFEAFDFNENKIILKNVMKNIRGKKFYLKLDYSFEYLGQIFFQKLIDNKDVQFTDDNDELTKRETGLIDIYLNTDSGKPVASREKYESGNIIIDKKEYKIQVKGRGNSSWGSMPKHNYNIKLDKSDSLLGMKKNSKWVLISNYDDKTLIRNTYTVFLGKKVFNNFDFTTDFKQVNLYINNKYSGTYLFGERISINKNRVAIQDISKLKKDINGDKIIDVKDGGFILEINLREDEEINFRTKKDVSLSLKDPDKVDKNTKNYIISLVQKMEDTFSKDIDEIKKVIDINSFIDWYLINEFNKNVDSGWYSSIYLYFNPKNQKFYMGPLWDYDLSFGNVNYNDCDKAEGFYIKNKNVWYKELFKNEEFVKLVKKRWNDRKNILKQSIESEIDKETKEIKESSYYNFERWPVLGTYVWPNADGAENRKTFESEVEYLKQFCFTRFKWMDEEIQKL